MAPYFPPNDPDKFAIVQRVFGTGHIVKLLQGLEVEQREDAVNSIVYEASARVKDPVHGCAKDVHQLQKRIADLESQLAVKETELKHLQSEYDNLVLFLGTESIDSQFVEYPVDSTSQPREDGLNDKADPLMSCSLLWEE
ncbi:LOB domain-containing protein 1-like [Cryptomeria japonica]|uniref:LOB domain-containing protein 1-like n=1 Tax=Cryptomeria japonica TaxID=3369 RepID=UPI0027D9DE92|nr:LOB domain-containing protein 1-like [Cryptomeria japonica]